MVLVPLDWEGHHIYSIIIVDTVHCTWCFPDNIPLMWTWIRWPAMPSWYVIFFWDELALHRIVQKVLAGRVQILKGENKYELNNTSSNNDDNKVSIDDDVSLTMGTHARYAAAHILQNSKIHFFMYYIFQCFDPSE